MGQIRRMDEHLATLIAAGEVVAGPVSVVRELVDNALDAGATSVEMDLEEGGIRLVRVADDGQGMDADDAQLCFERHATSKLLTSHDLGAIHTLGFRGEALAAIMAVARVRLETRRAADQAGTFVRAAGGKVLDAGSTARRSGTTLEVSDLFFNTPARRGYLDSPAVEGRRVLQAVTRLAVARPDVRFLLRSDGRELLDLARAGDLLTRLRQIHGAAFADALLPLAAERGGVVVRGYVTRPSDAVRQVRRSAFAVNGRAFESYELRRVLFNALAEVAPSGRYPEAVVQIELPAQEVDANVSPDKSEVRFRLPGQIWAAVTDAVRHAFGEREAVAGFPKRSASASEAAPPEAAPPEAAPPEATVPVDASEGGQSPERPVGRPLALPLGSATTRPSTAPFAVPAPAAVREAPRSYPQPSTSAHAAPIAEASGAMPRRHGIPERPTTILQVAGTFLVCPVDEGLLVIDQHSAHERVNYERLRRRYDASRATLQQRLLMPDVLHPDAEHVALLEEMQPYLARLGFELGVAGPREVWIQAVPASLGNRSASAVLERLVDAYLAVRDTGVRADEAAEGITPVEDRLLKTLACHSAIKAGQPLSDTEIRALWRDLIDVDLACHDVHGRPAALLLSATELARRMGRALPFDRAEG